MNSWLSSGWRSCRRGRSYNRRQTSKRRWTSSHRSSVTPGHTWPRRCPNSTPRRTFVTTSRCSPCSPRSDRPGPNARPASTP
jgi:hypothetical protein